MQRLTGWKLLLLAMIVTAMVYSPGLSGSWLFDDYPNIVDNKSVQPADVSLASLVGAALSSPASDFKRPLASLSFATNYLASGLDPFWMKLTNLFIHLLNGLLVFLLARALLQADMTLKPAMQADSLLADSEHETPESRRAGVIAALIAASWLLLPINLTSVLYVVQRMESMLVAHRSFASFLLCVTSITLPTALGLTAKETAVMLPLYALLIEWVLFNFRTSPSGARDWRVIGLFLVVFVIPMALGTIWVLPGLLQPSAWATRDFTLGTRLLSEARIVADYVAWTLLPTSHALSFYHDDFQTSTGLLTPWTTLASMLFLAVLAASVLWLRLSRPLASIGIALFLGCHLLTGTVLPLELIYEHRNYFASFGLLLAIIPSLIPRRGLPISETKSQQLMRLTGSTLLIGLMLWWMLTTGTTAYAWGDSLRLARELATRAPNSPRAQYELGRTYIIYSRYDPGSPFTKLAYAPLERAASLPKSSILPQQALIFMNSRMHLPLKSMWWDSMIAKLESYKSGVQDESSLSALAECARAQDCDLPKNRMKDAFVAALSHPAPSARLLSIYGGYAWNVLGDRELGLRMTEAAVAESSNEPVYRESLTRMYISQGQIDQARQQISQLRQRNVMGRLDGVIESLEIQVKKTPATVN
ncbi:hypothetical protein [Dyella silvatica]|uniref:hypothetical protein n=1 Tax=Dyella silvatica TaxID=2992128 RepID=UPI002253F4AE|nr:hypothetical protein [Dyella silvatica]